MPMTRTKSDRYTAATTAEYRDATAREMCRTPQEPMTERDRLIDMLRRNLKRGLMEGQIRRVLEYLERHP